MSASSETDKISRPPNWWQLMLKNSFGHSFLLGAVVPVLLFYGLHRAGYSLWGAIVAGLWGLGVTVITYWRTQEINIFAAIATSVNMIEIVGTLLTQSEQFYLAGAAIDSFFYGVLFLGSLWLPRTLIQILAEATPYGRQTPDPIRQLDAYGRLWRILTLLWGMTYLLKCVILVIGQFFLPLEPFLLLRTLIGQPLFIVMMIFNYWYPFHYWKKYWQRQPEGAWQQVSGQRQQ